MVDRSKTYISGKEMILDLGFSLNIPNDIITRAITIYEEERHTINFDRINFSIACLCYAIRLSDGYFVSSGEIMSKSPVFVNIDSLNHNIKHLLKKRGLEPKERIKVNIPEYLRIFLTDLEVPSPVFNEALFIYVTVKPKIMSTNIDNYSFCGAIIFLSFAKQEYYFPLWSLSQGFGIDLQKAGDYANLISKELSIKIPSPSERIKWRRFNGPQFVSQSKD